MVVTRSTLAVFLTVLTLMASGCTGGGSEETADPLRTAAPAEFDESTGGIQGMVVDEEFVPVEGVEIALLDRTLSTVSDPDGLFSFSNVPPGSYLFHFLRIGYESHQETVEVRAGEVIDVEVRLTGLSITEPFQETHTQRGLFGCGTSWAPGIPPPPLPGIQDLPKIDDPTNLWSDGNMTDGLPTRIGGVAGCGTLSSPAFEDTPISAFDSFSLDWEVNFTTKEWRTSIFEAEWVSNQLAGRGLAMIWEVNECFNRPEYEFSDESGPSPLYGRADQAQIQGIITNSTARTDLCPGGPEDCNEDGCNLLSRIFAQEETTGSESGDIGVSFQQQYNLYHTFWFLAPAPEGWTALEQA